MKVICILQNAWSTVDRLPIIFEPNPRNKSAKTIAKMLEPEDRYYFSNTTPVVTRTANGRADIDAQHVIRLFGLVSKFDLILVCGKQAKLAVNNFIFKQPVMFIKHPAARDLSNLEIQSYKNQINEIRNSIIIPIGRDGPV